MPSLKLGLQECGLGPVEKNKGWIFFSSGFAGILMFKLDLGVSILFSACNSMVSRQPTP